MDKEQFQNLFRFLRDKTQCTIPHDFAELANFVMRYIGNYSIQNQKEFKSLAVPEKKQEASDCWEYESKCRKCGTIENWSFGTKEVHSQKRFSDWVNIRLQIPEIGFCEHCQKHTVQDIVSTN